MINIASKTEVGRRLYERRGKVSAAKLARAIKVPTSTVTRWERGKIPDACILIPKLAAEMGVEPNDLLLAKTPAPMADEHSVQKIVRLNLLIEEVITFAANTDDEGESLHELTEFLAGLDRRWNPAAKTSVPTDAAVLAEARVASPDENVGAGVMVSKTIAPPPPSLKTVRRRSTTRMNKKKSS